MNLNEEKKYFLKDQFWSLTISAAFSRANVYAKNLSKEMESEKFTFKYKLFKFIDEMVSSQYGLRKVEEEQHIENIISIQKFTNEFEVILEKKHLSVGVCQKLLNLYLKYLWCANIIEFTPPHFPLDRLIQGKKIYTNWTELEDSTQYKEIINKIRNEQNKAIWELEEYNAILRK